MDIDSILRSASIAQVGGFRPPRTHLTSWFGGEGVSLPSEELPTYNGEKMFPLLQVRIDELPVAPEALKGTAMLIVFMNREALPYDAINGDGYLIREYERLDNLQPIPNGDENTVVKKFPIKWDRVERDAPTWEDLLETEFHKYEDDNYFDKYTTYEGTKFGGFPMSVQGGVGIKDFVFQIDSEAKAGWHWGDNGLGYFFKKDGQWYLDWQCC